MTTHPLDSLTADEINKAVDLYRAYDVSDENTLFINVTLVEPSKESVRSYKEGEEFDRSVKIIGVDSNPDGGFVASIDLKKEQVTALERLPNEAQAAYSFAEVGLATVLTKQNKEYQDALKNSVHAWIDEDEYSDTYGKQFLTIYFHSIELAGEAFDEQGGISLFSPVPITLEDYYYDVDNSVLEFNSWAQWDSYYSKNYIRLEYAGFSIPSNVLSISLEITSKAPVLPADTTISVSLFLTLSIASHILVFLPLLAPSNGLSVLLTTLSV